ncbi:DUF2848 domain-containing protein [Propylenella binzhouense]|uniref:DUF2848 domain-containing protein n=1 Tax=Propylenella binzhouense TaxID=2555902 RepID=A0A964WSW4_9HYPH|nr:DUF2848 domain-containing protein [Propylenella binzhouense]MYZ47392.1 DUF2848 domain-containing protein [Propylenella binzhouense]
MPQIRISIEGSNGSEASELEIRELVVAGWTGRDKAAMEKHIAELEELGVKRPARTPIYYRVAADRLTTASSIQVCGGDSSGEVEFLLAAHPTGLLVGLGSDHTDRKLETYNVTLSKQACEKPIGARFWRFDDVIGHWDELVLRAHIVTGGRRELYQEGRLSGMLPPGELMAGYDGGARLAAATAMFGGTFAAIGGIRPADRFEGELEDPVLGRKLAFAYDVATLPIHG